MEVCDLSSSYYGYITWNATDQCSCYCSLAFAALLKEWRLCSISGPGREWTRYLGWQGHAGFWCFLAYSCFLLLTFFWLTFEKQMAEACKKLAEYMRCWRGNTCAAGLCRGRQGILDRLPVQVIHPQERVRQLKPTAQRSRDTGFGAAVRL